MIAAVTVLMIAHLAEVLVWSFTYATFPRRGRKVSDIVYFAFVNYTTLGYGDVTPVEALAFARAHDRDETAVLLFWAGQRAVVF